MRAEGLTHLNGLLGSAVLEVAIGLALIYLLLAVFCAAANEWIAALLHTRAGMLRQGIVQLLHGDVFAEQFYGHPLIRALMKDGEHPSYLPARTFARTVMDIATPLHAGSITFEQLEEGIKALPESGARASLLAVIQSADGRLEDAQRAIEGWYNDGMDRVSSWYRRRTQLWTALVAAAITVAANADTIRIARDFWLEPALRGSVAAAAIAGASAHTAVQNIEPVLGWSGVTDWSDPAAWMTRIVGWLVTVVAVSLGAPFWFDVLNKIVNVRFAGRPPEDAPRR
jgi:hypothetical protein